MIYLAVALIGLGMAFLGLYFYLLRVGGPVEPEWPEGKSGKDTVSFEAQDTSFVAQKQAKAVSMNSPQEKKAAPLIQKEHDFKQAASQLVRETEVQHPERSIRPAKRKKKKKPALELTGVLYLDHARKLRRYQGNAFESFGNDFDALKYMGKGRLRAHPDSFEIECGDASWKYKVHKLDQILFQKSGLAFVTLDETRPIALFLTDESNQLKDFVKKHTK